MLSRVTRVDGGGDFAHDVNFGRFLRKGERGRCVSPPRTHLQGTSTVYVDPREVCFEGKRSYAGRLETPMTKVAEICGKIHEEGRGKEGLGRKKATINPHSLVPARK